MRTTLDLPEALVEEARSTLGGKSKTDTIIFALRDLIRRKEDRGTEGSSRPCSARCGSGPQQTQARPAPQAANMIVVDTSVWVSVFRSRRSAEAGRFATLLDADEILLPAPVRTELLGGVRSADRQTLRRILTRISSESPQSILSAITGSILVARRAGNQDATPATSSNVPDTAI